MRAALRDCTRNLSRIGVRPVRPALRYHTERAAHGD